MKKQYITELNNFYFFVRKYGLCSSEIAVYHALLHINNRCMWQEWFTASLAELGMLSGVNVNTIYKVRNRLKKMGIIDTQSQGGRRCCLYRLISFDTAMLQSGDSLNTGKLQSGDSRVTALIEKDKDKDKEKEIAAAAAASTAHHDNKIYKLYEQCIGELDDLIKERLDDYTEKICPQAVEYAIKEAVYNNSKTLCYVLAICNSLFKAGVKTPEDLEKRRREYDEQKSQLAKSRDMGANAVRNTGRDYIKSTATYTDRDLFPDVFE